MQGDELDRVIAGLTKGERRCLLTWGHADPTKRAPVPDSIWHGELSWMKRYNPDGSNAFILSDRGIAIRNRIKELETNNES